MGKYLLRCGNAFVDGKVILCTESEAVQMAMDYEAELYLMVPGGEMILIYRPGQ